MPELTDQLGRIVHFTHPFQKIISLVPSQTELLYDLGLDKEIVGITKFCVHPREWFLHKAKVGGTKKIRFESIHQLNPDLIIANKEENNQQDVEKLAADYTLWISDIKELDDACGMIIALGQLTGREAKAAWIIDQIRSRFSKLRQWLIDFSADRNMPATAYLIWQNPYMAAGAGTFIHHLMACCGFRNIFENRPRYPEINISDLQARGCELLLLSSEPFPFKEKHLAQIQQKLPDTRILLVDGEMFSWYGSRLLLAPAYFEQLLLQIRQ